MNPNAEIRNCEFRFKCPKTWDSLKKTDDESIRFCDQCNRTVHFCKTAGELQRAIIKNQCVALEIKPSDPGPSAYTIGEPAPPEYRS